MGIKLKQFVLWLADAAFFGVIYVSVLELIDRPPVHLTVFLLFVLYCGVFWFFRFYNLEIFSNRVLYLSRILRINIIVTLLFWGLWWLALKTEWPEASRLLLLVMIAVFGLLYSMTVRQIIGRFLLKRIRVFVSLSPEFAGVFEEDLSRFFKNIQHLDNHSADMENLKSGFVFITYRARESVATRADMWQDYFRCIKELKEFAGKSGLKVFVFNPYNLELKNDASVMVINGIPALEVSGSAHPLYRRVVKPLLDRLLALLLLPVLLVFHPLAALLIRLNFSRPVVFRQIRLGRRGRLFGLFKYRTMKIVSGVHENEVDDVHCEYIRSLLKEEELAKFHPHRLVPAVNRIRKMQNRKEISLAGTFFRKASLDELPQIINVLQGDMSLVGPRPILPYEMDMFPQWSRARLECPQGVTGLWQVSGRGVMPQHTSLFLDAYYSMEYNFFLDILITIRTIGSVFDFSRVY